MPSHGRSAPAFAFAAMLCAASAILPQAANAADTPPTNSAVQEFVQSLPYGPGQLSASDVANARGAAVRSDALSPTARRELRSLGVEGEAARELAEAALLIGRPARAERREAGPGDPPPAAVLKRLLGADGPGGMGLALPLIAALIVLVTVVTAPARPR
jgi:hypothetical protein